MALPLASCTSLFDRRVAQHSQTRTIRPHNAKDAVAFVENLSLSRLALMGNLPEYADISGNVMIMRNYALQKHRKAQKLTLVLMDYKIPGDPADQQIVAAFDKATDYASVQTVMDKLNAISGVLSNIGLLTVTLQPDNSWAPPDDASQLKSGLDDVQQQLLSQSHRLPVADDIRSELSLIQFYIDHQYQDAAYLTLDNVKRMLAQAAQEHLLDEKTVREFCNKLETAEGNLKETLPYRL